MENEESNIIVGIVLAVVFLGLFLFAVVVIVNSLNKANSQAGVTLSGQMEEILYNVVAVPQTLIVSNLSNAQCHIVSVKDLLGNTLPTSNYSVNNCQVTYTP